MLQRREGKEGENRDEKKVISGEGLSVVQNNLCKAWRRFTQDVHRVKHGATNSQPRHHMTLSNFTNLSVPHLPYGHDSSYLEAAL